MKTELWVNTILLGALVTAYTVVYLLGHVAEWSMVFSLVAILVIDAFALHSAWRYIDQLRDELARKDET